MTRAPAPDETPTRRRWWLVAVAAGLLLGPLDLWGQVAAPYPWAHVFNSPAVWAAAAFTYGRWVGWRPASSVGAVVLLAVAVEAYYVADVLIRGADSANPTSATAAVWLLAAVAAGVIFGLAGDWAVERSGWRAVLGRAALPAVFGAEAVRHAIRIRTEPAEGRPRDLGQIAVVLGMIAIVLLIAVARRPDRRIAALVVVVAIGAAATTGALAAASI